MKLLTLAVAALALAGCAQKTKNNDAVRQGILDHLKNRAGLNMDSLVVEITHVEVKGNEANATVSFAPKGGPASQGMTMNYALELKDNKWTVKGRSGTGAGHGAGTTDGGGMGGGMENPHGSTPPIPGMPEMPAAGDGSGKAPAGDLPPGHPPMGGAKPAAKK